MILLICENIILFTKILKKFYENRKFSGALRNIIKRRLIEFEIICLLSNHLN